MRRHTRLRFLLACPQIHARRGAVRVALLLSLCCLAASGPAVAGDWPMWRYDAARGAASPHALPAQLQLQWSLQLAPPQPAWPPDQTKLAFDTSYEPIVVGKLLIVPSMVRDHVTAYDTASGRQRWRFFADGPVRFAPVAYGERVYFVADDGFLYCLQADDGQLQWKLRGGPSDLRVLGNERLISAWPARGAPVVADGTVYFAAGIWPFLGIFLHAVDAQTGKLVWTNSGSGANYIVQQHSSPAFAGVAPQGYLAVAGERLLVAGGRTVPAVYDRRTGDFLYYQPGSRELGKDAGGYAVATDGEWFFNGGAVYRASDGAAVGRLAVDVVAAPGRWLGVYQGAFAVRSLPIVSPLPGDAAAKPAKTPVRFAHERTTRLPAGLSRLCLAAGGRLYGIGDEDTVVAIDLPSPDRDAVLAWQAEVPGRIGTMVAGDERLFVVTREGGLYCFGGPPANGAAGRDNAPATPPADAASAAPAVPSNGGTSAPTAGEIVERTGVREGYGIIWGPADERLVAELLRTTDLNAIVVEPDESRVATLRGALAGSPLPGRRVAIYQGDPLTFRLPPYLASLMVVENPAAVGFGQTAAWVAAIYQALRPYGGVACLRLDEASQAALSAAVRAADLPGASVQRAGPYVLLRRTGGLPGAGRWTHQNADAGNTLVSDDRLVKLPLGLLWFGGPANDKILPRHGHGPMPQVVDGRLFIEGPDILRALDIYTGRLLWERELKDVGLFYNNTDHHPGAGAIGGNYVSVEDGLYVAYGRQALRLDPATGRTVREFVLPVRRDPELAATATATGAAAADGEPPYWGYLSVFQDLLIAGSSPVAPVASSRWKPDATGALGRFGEASRQLVVMDRHTGRVLWTRDADDSFRHNAIAVGQPAGQDRALVFCIDRMTDAQLALLKRRGVRLTDGRDTLYALDAQTGAVVWQKDDRIFGTWLSYTPQHDVLLQAGSANNDRAADEAARGMVAYRGVTGEVLWQNDLPCRGPCLLLDDRIITQTEAYELLTGHRVQRVHPLTGEQLAWGWSRNHGCNTAIGCPHLLTFRSAAAGFLDLAGDGGTGNFGGFRSSCTNNLVPAGGVLSVPDYTRTCTCSYQNQTSLALVPMPDVEVWTFNALTWSGQPVRRLGVNFGAPGDRRADDGTLWLDYPSVGGKSPEVPIRVKFLDGVRETAAASSPPRFYRLHASQVQGDAPAWVSASGLRGAADIEITLADKHVTGTRRYTVRLCFCEIEELSAGQRRFEVRLQDQPVLAEFDIVAAAGAARRGIVREFRSVSAGPKLTVSLRATRGSTHPPLLSGVELVAEGS